MAENDEPIPEMPQDFAAIPPTQAWERVQRERRGRARVEADLATTRERMGTLEAQLAEAAPLRERLTALEAELATERARAEAASLRVPLVRAGIDDDEVADLLVTRWRSSQATAAEDARQDLATWLRESAPADKIAARLLPGQAPAPTEAPKAPPRVNAGAEQVVAPSAARITREQYLAEARLNRGYTPLMIAYMEQEGYPTAGLIRAR